MATDSYEPAGALNFCGVCRCRPEMELLVTLPSRAPPGEFVEPVVRVKALQLGIVVNLRPGEEIFAHGLRVVLHDQCRRVRRAGFGKQFDDVVEKRSVW